MAEFACGWRPDSAIVSYDGANRIGCVDGNGNSQCGDAQDIPYIYDAYGNLTNDGVNTYTYDAAMRLISVTGGGRTTTYAYNGDGDRVSQTVVEGSVTTTSKYVLDVAGPLTKVVAETTTVNGTPQPTIYYLHGLALLAQSDGTSTEYFLYDGLGSVRQVMASTSGVLMAQTFDPYGNVYSRSGANESTYGFSGEQTDSNGLVFLRARYYNPAQGRFFQRDTWRGSNQRPQSLNPYSYGLDNPVLYTDPSGHDPWWCDSRPNPADCYEGAGTLRPSVTPLTEAQWRLAKQEAELFGLPVELVAGTIAVEIEYDTDWYDYYLDVYLQQLPLILHYNDPCHFSTVWVHEAADAWLEGYQSYFGALGGRGPGNGIANIHIDTARNAEQYYIQNYPGTSLLQAAPDDYYRMAVLLTDEGNIHYTAAILRQLADLRTGTRQDHTHDLDDTDMEVIYSGFRADLEGCYVDVAGFQDATASPKGCFGSQIREYLDQYRRRLEWESDS